MTSPHNRYVGGALDLGALKEQADARAAAQERAAAGAASQSQGIAPFFEVTDTNFEQELIRRSAQVPVIAIIGTSRSEASEKLKQDFAQLAQAGGLQFIVGYIDADAYPQIAQVFGVQMLPTTVAIAGGQPITNFEGAQPLESLQQWVNALVQQVGPKLAGLEQEAPQDEQPENPRLAQAEGFLNSGDFDGAMAVYEQLLAEEPHNVQYKQARDTTKLLKRLDPANRDADPIAQADANPKDVQAQLDGADAEVVAGNVEAAFTRLIEAMKRTGGEDKNVLKERLLELFGLFDAADPRVLSARTQLASALY